MNLSYRSGRDLPLLILASAAAAVVLNWSMKDDMAAPEVALKEHHGLATKRASTYLPALFSTDDYPQAALRREEQGTVAFTLAINPRGRVTNCVITSSSNSAALDQATCSILQRRARFTPARDANGKAVADLTTGRIRWQLPED